MPRRWIASSDLRGGRWTRTQGLQNNLNRWYDASLGRWISPDPTGFAAGDTNEYRYVGNSPANATDPNGLGAKSKVVGWVVRTVGKRLIRVQAIFTEEQAARLFLGKCATYGLHILVRDGREQALKIARIIEAQVRPEFGKAGAAILEGGEHAAGHRIRNLLGQIIGRGTSHVQIEAIRGRHIFYSVIAGAIATLGAGLTAHAGDDYSIDITEVYSDPKPGQSIVHGLTASYWAGENSWLSYLDWLNPAELDAVIADGFRAIEREMQKKLLGYTITVRDKEQEPIVSFNFSPDGELKSVVKWKDGVMQEPITAEAYFASLETKDARAERQRQAASAAHEVAQKEYDYYMKLYEETETRLERLQRVTANAVPGSPI